MSELLKDKRYTDNRARPFLRRALITRRPVWLRIRALKPDVRFRLRQVPSRVRFVIANHSNFRICQKKSQSIIIHYVHEWHTEL